MSPSPATRSWTSMGSVSRLVAMEAGRRGCLETTVQVKRKIKEETRRLWRLVTLADHRSVLQVTIVSPEPGAASLKSTGTQGDMEKADMVDGEPAQRDQDPAPPHTLAHLP